MSLIVTTTSGVTAGFDFTDTMRTPPTRTVRKAQRRHQQQVEVHAGTIADRRPLVLAP